MKKIITVCLFAFMAFSTKNSNAQDPRFSLGLELALPMGDYGDAVSTGFGGSFRYEGPIADKLALTGTLGYIIFPGKDIDINIPGSPIVTIEGKSTYFVPIQLGLKYYFMEQQEGFYVHLMAGSHLYEAFSYNSTFERVTESKAALSYAPEIGYHLANVDLGLRYQLVSTTGSTSSYLGIRVAYVFGSN